MPRRDDEPSAQPVVEPQPSHFEQHMRSLLKVSDHSQLHPAIHSAAREVQRKAEAAAALGAGTSEYVQWKLSSEEGPEAGQLGHRGQLGQQGQRGQQGRILEVQAGTSGSKAIQSPGLNSAPLTADMNVSLIRFGSVSYPALVDWRASPALDTGVLDQKSCESCWAVVMTDVISMSWSLVSRFLTPVPLSPQHVCDCAFPRCCSGGWPEWALAFAVMNKGLAPLASYPYLGRDRQQCQTVNKTLQSGKVTAWEKLPASSPAALMQTLAQHPVVVLIYASGSFLRYAGGIFRGADCTKRKSVSHALVVMGYNASGSDPYWIAKNSWGTGWGEGGYVRIQMNGNVCGFGTEPSVYPTMFRVSTPCDALPGPCGAGTCFMMPDAVTARCLCPQGFVERLEDSAPKCVSSTPCSAQVNPCAFGTCSNEWDGSHTCTCPPGTVVGSDNLGGETCIVNSFQSGLETYTTLPGDDCQGLSYLFNLTSTRLLTMNPFLDCQGSITKGTVVVVHGADAGVGCGSRDSVRPNDTCSTLASRNGITVPQLVSINKGLVCQQGVVIGTLLVSQHVCVLPGQLALSSPFERSCGEAVVVYSGQTCVDLSNDYNVSLAIVEWLNPGLDCGNSLPTTSVCISPLLLGMEAVTCTAYYNVTHADTCFTVAAGAGLDMAQFLGLNPGLKCSRPSWNIGRSVCVNGTSIPFDDVVSEPNMVPYYVKSNDTLSSIAISYLGQCDNAGSPGNTTSLRQFTEDICWANSWMPDCTDRRVVAGSMMLIPCVRDIGATSCSASSATDPTTGFVCGNNYVTYATYACASVSFATPTVLNQPCRACDQYCISIAGVTISNFWGSVPSGCTDRVCSYPYLPSAATTSQACTSATPCQLHQLHCCSATSSLSLSATPISGSVGCQKYRSCMVNAGCSTFVTKPCGYTCDMAACGF